MKPRIAHDVMFDREKDSSLPDVLQVAFLEGEVVVSGTIRRIEDLKEINKELNKFGIGIRWVHASRCG